MFFNLSQVPCAYPSICLKRWTLHHGLKYPVVVWLSGSRNESQSGGSTWEELSLASAVWGRGRRGRVGHTGKFNAAAATAHDRAPTPARIAQNFHQPSQGHCGATDDLATALNLSYCLIQNGYNWICLRRLYGKKDLSVLVAAVARF